MMNQTGLLAQYAATIRYEDIPDDVINRAKQCIADTIAVIIFGYELPWSRMVVRFAEKKTRPAAAAAFSVRAERVCMHPRPRSPTERWRTRSRWTI
jgi:2-methylcitrate dehydratase PrpD